MIIARVGWISAAPFAIFPCTPLVRAIIQTNSTRKSRPTIAAARRNVSIVTFPFALILRSTWFRLFCIIFANRARDPKSAACETPRA